MTTGEIKEVELKYETCGTYVSHRMNVLCSSHATKDS